MTVRARIGPLAALIALVRLLAGDGALAADFPAATGRVCDKLKLCAKEKITAQPGATPQRTEQALQLVDQTCAGLRRRYQAAMQRHALHEPAIRCLDSMARLDCPTLGQGSSTAECQQLETMVGQYPQ